MPIAVYIASVPDREHMLGEVVASIRPQVDSVFVALNNYDHVPPFLSEGEYVMLDNSRSDGAKFYDAEHREGYVFTLDDDLAVPPGYVLLLKNKVDQYGSVVSLHGKIYPRPVTHFRRTSAVYRCLNTVASDVKVDLIGTGCMAYHTDIIKVKYNDFPIGGMADVWFSKVARHQGVDMYVIAHKRGYLRYLYPTNTIWQNMGQATKQTEVLKSFLK